MRTSEATFDPSKAKGSWKPIDDGNLYPAHICGLNERPVTVRGNKATVFELEYEIAEEAKELTQLMWKMNGYEYDVDEEGNRMPVHNEKGQQQIGDCGHVVGKRFKGRGVFLFDAGAESGRNKAYFDWLTNLGVETTEVDNEGTLVHKLAIPDLEDVVGKPYLVRLNQERFVTKDTRDLPKQQQEWRSVWKVKDSQLWAEGNPKSSEELEADLPF